MKAKILMWLAVYVFLNIPLARYIAWKIEEYKYHIVRYMLYMAEKY